MFRALWKIFIINILCVSLFAADVNQVANHIANLRARQEAMKPGTASYDAATYNQITVDIKILEQELATLTTQSDKLASLEKKLAATPEADPGYITLANQVANAQHDKQVTMDQISTASIKMANEEAQRAQEAMLNGLAGNPAEELLAKSRIEARDAVALQEQALNYSQQSYNMRNSLYQNARRAADWEISQMKAWPEQRCTGVEQIPNPAHTGAGQPATIPHYFCTPGDIQAAEDRHGIAAAKAIVDAEKANIDKNSAELARVKLLQAKLDLATEDNLKNVDQAMRQKISQSLGHDKIKSAVADMTKATLSDAPDVKAAAAEYQAAMEADITMVILGTVSTRLMNCSARSPSFRVPDLLTAATAGQAFVAGEIAEYASIYSLKNDLLTKLKDMSGDPYDKQIEALRKMLNMFQEIRSTTVLKKNLRLAAQNAYFAASTAAAMEARMQAQVANACTSGISSKVQKGSSSANMSGALGGALCAIWVNCVISCAACECCYCEPTVVYSDMSCVSPPIAFLAGYLCKQGGSSSVSANQNRIYACQDQNASGAHVHSDTTQKPSVTSTISEGITKQCWNMGGDGNIQGPANDGCGTIPFYATAGKGPYSGCQEADDYYDKYNVWCPVNSLNGTQEANQFTTLSSMGVAKEAVVNFIKTQSPVFADALDTQLASPIWRSVAWGALGSLVSEAMINNDVMLARIDSDMKMIQDIIDGLIKQLGTGKLAIGTNNMPGQADQSKNYATLSTLPSLEKSQTADASGAKKVTDLLLNNLKNVQLPPAVAEQVKQVARVGDQLRGANSISAEAMRHINALNANSNAIRSEMFASHNALQKVLSRKGSQYNLTKAMNQFTDTIKNSTKDNLAKNNTTAGKMRALMSGSDTEPKVNFGDYAMASKARLNEGANTDGESKFAKSNAKNYFQNVKHTSSTIGGSHNYRSTHGSGGKSTSSQKISNSEATANSESVSGATGVSAASNTETQGRLSQNELDALGRSQTGEKEQASEKINEQNGFGIFEIISNRYQKTGYPRLLKKE